MRDKLYGRDENRCVNNTTLTLSHNGLTCMEAWDVEASNVPSVELPWDEVIHGSTHVPGPD